MTRFFGLMPWNEADIIKKYKIPDTRYTVTIQAGSKGWTTVYSDYTTDFEDIDDTPENNLKRALKSVDDFYSLKGKRLIELTEDDNL